ncbi:MAG: DNA-3-methyladenine glycosylase [Candidatus Pacearchaeota archaeon]
MKPISERFFKRSTIEIAKALLGCYLVNETSEGMVIGKIVETEAYLSNDPASHSSRGMTRRNETMFGAPGKAYVYFTYGMYHCFNVVTAPEGIGEAVLIRALEPIEGVDIMKKRRKKERIKELCSGPAKLAIAMGIDKKHNGISLIDGKLKILEGKKANEKEIIKTTRIGISEGKNLPYRFYLKNSDFVSKK